MNSITTIHDQMISIEPEAENEGRELGRLPVLWKNLQTPLWSLRRKLMMVVRKITRAMERDDQPPPWSLRIPMMKKITRAMERDNWKSFKRLLDAFPEEEERKVNDEDDKYSWTNPFIDAMEKDDWKSFKYQLDLNLGAEAKKVNEEGETFLHLAVASGKEQFVIELVKRMSSEDLRLKNTDGCTALYLAAISGTKEMAEIMVEKNMDLVQVRNAHELPVVTAARHENTDMVHYLYWKTPQELLGPDKGKDGATLLTKLIISDLFDIALDLLEKYPTLAKSEDYDGRNAITVLAKKPSAFPSGRLHGKWHHCKSILGFKTQEKRSEVHALQVLKIISTQVSKMDDKQLKDAGVYEAVLEATKFGIVEFVYKVMNCNRHMVNCKDASGKGTFLYAIMYRQKKIFNLLQDMRDKKNWFSYIGKDDGNNTLHEAAIYNRFSQIDRISGVALQMQREKWMKETAAGCMVVAALIATVVFAAAFTLPGGNKENSGDPNLLDSKLFMFFIIVDAVSLLSSCSSMLMFLSILTSRYAEQDFLVSLPTKLILGLSSLIFAIGSMMAAFCATLFISVRHNNYWVPIMSTILAAVPVTLFILLQCPLLVDMSYKTNFTHVILRGSWSKANCSDIAAFVDQRESKSS
ncbi:Ankyrin repeat family protein [Thalictrum thalictroides]|uniref:Ankyrin repeat family protein n=1 Tax=Thalictrum thalictroides TaxID=46969 RepID=A0A7J6XEA3_THATH|nr:Ankyrin repeat family protein [Thalictrum thalictroides]